MQMDKLVAGTFVGIYLLFYQNSNPARDGHFCTERPVSEGNGHHSGPHTVVTTGFESISVTWKFSATEGESFLSPHFLA